MTTVSTRVPTPGLEAVRCMMRLGGFKFEWVAPVGAVLGLDPSAAAGEVVAAAFLGDDALKAELADLLPQRASPSRWPGVVDQ